MAVPSREEEIKTRERVTGGRVRPPRRTSALRAALTIVQAKVNVKKEQLVLGFDYLGDPFYHFLQDAAVNAGPAMFISGNGPNPLMVQDLLKFMHLSLFLVSHDLRFSDQPALRSRFIRCARPGIRTRVPFEARRWEFKITEARLTIKKPSLSNFSTASSAGKFLEPTIQKLIRRKNGRGHRGGNEDAVAVVAAAAVRVGIEVGIEEGGFRPLRAAIRVPSNQFASFCPEWETKIVGDRIIN
ncbi:hypothetical protein FCM35_KLT19257 [Carex littledalei]|uniref:Uncharacterized protein n=1 Tax=Carex littledalei TaxID=544730 RepID=A0A833VFB7_9POAL|nr:hypothetical protein FCM35_KLT19257 [Carex littledalei]